MATSEPMPFTVALSFMMGILTTIVAYSAAR